MFVAVLVRRLRPGKTYEDFVRAWYPDFGYGVTVRGPMLARSISDDREILVVAFVDVSSRDDVVEMFTKGADQERVRHDRIEDVIEETSVRGIYELVDEFDFSTDRTVAEHRPPDLDRPEPPAPPGR
jgi:hypothetical protein